MSFKHDSEELSASDYTDNFCISMGLTHEKKDTLGVIWEKQKNIQDE